MTLCLMTDNSKSRLLSVVCVRNWHLINNPVTHNHNVHSHSHIKLSLFCILLLFRLLLSQHFEFRLSIFNERFTASVRSLYRVFGYSGAVLSRIGHLCVIDHRD